MAENSKIEWCDHTTNLWWGCSKVHTGCKNCYAEYLSDTRYKKNLWGEKNIRKRILSAFTDLDRYQKQAEKKGIKYKIFIGSMMDIFEDDKEIQNPTDVIDSIASLRFRLWRKIHNNQYNNLIFLLLTKRPQNILKMIPTSWQDGYPNNVWFGTSVSDIHTWQYADQLKATEIPNLFVSIEPQVARIGNIDLEGIRWVIQGGESGNKKRPFDISWAYKMKEVCQQQNVPYFFKQIDKKQPIPQDLMIREFPENMK